MFENSPIIKDHSRPAVKLAASGIFMGLCEISALFDADYAKTQAYVIVYQHYTYIKDFQTFQLKEFAI